MYPSPTFQPRSPESTNQPASPPKDLAEGRQLPQARKLWPHAGDLLAKPTTCTKCTHTRRSCCSPYGSGKDAPSSLPILMKRSDLLEDEVIHDPITRRETYKSRRAVTDDGASWDGHEHKRCHLVTTPVASLGHHLCAHLQTAQGRRHPGSHRAGSKLHRGASSTEGGR